MNPTTRRICSSLLKHCACPPSIPYFFASWLTRIVRLAFLWDLILPCILARILQAAWSIAEALGRFFTSLNINPHETSPPFLSPNPQHSGPAPWLSFNTDTLRSDIQQGQVILLTFAVAFFYKWFILLQWSSIRITQNANIPDPNPALETFLQEKSSSVIEFTSPYDVPLVSPPDRSPLMRASPPIEPQSAITSPVPQPVAGDNIKSPHLAGTVEDVAFNDAFHWIIDAGGFRGFKPLSRNLALVIFKFTRLILVTVVLPHTVGRAVVSIKAKWLFAPLRAVAWIPPTLFAQLSPSNPTQLETEHSTLEPFFVINVFTYARYKFAETFVRFLPISRLSFAILTRPLRQSKFREDEEKPTQ
ncbi:hypothetical protein BT69DRAFT_1329889 [Atractiella rhizophila]|nr:hypothetical protein BT69DRAFT_1329889 [Atractiella rhizophila]